MHSGTYARAAEFRNCAVYSPAKRPGYTAWASLFQFGNGDLGLAFNEIRQGRNAGFTPPTLEFVEAMGLPYQFSPVCLPAANPDLVSEYVNLRSSDGGRSWQETGRCPVHTRHYWHVGFPDSRIVRLVGTQYARYEQGDARHGVVVEESRDGGNVWREIGRFLDGCFFYGHKLKKLSDGSLIAAGPVYPSFGPGGTSRVRQTRLAGEIRPAQSCFMVSRDGGHTWEGPHYILPGIDASEPDFIELPGGDLLFVNSTVQLGRACRQMVRRTPNGYINEPLMEIRRGRPENDDSQGGITPETITVTPDGLIVGARRGGPYTCSSDLGENWYEIADAPDCPYQPMIERLPDGRFLTVWHWGHDSAFGEVDMYIGTHSFRVDASLPAPTRLDLERELSADGSRYVNAWRATLTANGKPAADKDIVFRTEDVYCPDGRPNVTPLSESADVFTARSDADGVARLRLDNKDRSPDFGDAYRIDVVFCSSAGDGLQDCYGPEEAAYAIRPVRNNPAPYPIIFMHGLVVITPETAARFPELSGIVSRLDRRKPDIPLERWIELSGSEERARRILEFLEANHVVSLQSSGVYRWFRSAQCGEEIVQEVRISDTKEYCV